MERECLRAAERRGGKNQCFFVRSGARMVFREANGVTTATDGPGRVSVVVVNAPIITVESVTEAKFVYYTLGRAVANQPDEVYVRFARASAPPVVRQLVMHVQNLTTGRHRAGEVYGIPLSPYGRRADRLRVCFQLEGGGSSTDDNDSSSRTGRRGAIVQRRDAAARFLTRLWDRLWHHRGDPSAAASASAAAPSASSRWRRRRQYRAL